MFVSKINHNGREIIFFDYTTCKTQEEMIQRINESAEFVKKYPTKVFSISDFTGTFAGQEFMNEANRLNKEVFSEKIEKGTALGITGIKKMLLEGYNLISKVKIHPFKTKEEALEYLTK